MNRVYFSCQVFYRDNIYVSRRSPTTKYDRVYPIRPFFLRNFCTKYHCIPMPFYFCAYAIFSDLHYQGQWIPLTSMHTLAVDRLSTRTALGYDHSPSLSKSTKSIEKKINRAITSIPSLSFLLHLQTKNSFTSTVLLNSYPTQHTPVPPGPTTPVYFDSAQSNQSTFPKDVQSVPARWLPAGVRLSAAVWPRLSSAASIDRFLPAKRSRFPGASTSATRTFPGPADRVPAAIPADWVSKSAAGSASAVSASAIPAPANWIWVSGLSEFL